VGTGDARIAATARHLIVQRLHTLPGRWYPSDSRRASSLIYTDFRLSGPSGSEGWILSFVVLERIGNIGPVTKRPCVTGVPTDRACSCIVRAEPARSCIVAPRQILRTLALFQAFRYLPPQDTSP
jgi:hypothetical protein